MDLDKIDASVVRRRLDSSLEMLLSRSRFLSARDQSLVKAVMHGVLNQRELSQLLGFHSPGTISRRLRSITNRLNDPLVAALIDRPGNLPAEHRQLAIEYFLQRQTIGQLSDLHRLSRAQVQQMLHYVRGWHAGMTGKM